MDAYGKTKLTEPKRMTSWYSVPRDRNATVVLRQAKTKLNLYGNLTPTDAGTVQI